MSDTASSLIAMHEDFELRRFDRSDSEWQLFRLVKRGAQRHCWHLGWDSQQQRLARNRDANLLLKHNASIREWVLDELRQRPSREPIEPASDVDVNDVDAPVAPAGRKEQTKRREVDHGDRATPIYEADEKRKQREESEANARWRQAMYFNALGIY